MLRTFVELRERLTSLRRDDGTTVPEYMLVLGFISLVVVVAFNTAGVGNAITAMGTDLAGKINP